MNYNLNIYINIICLIRMFHLVLYRLEAKCCTGNCNLFWFVNYAIIESNLFCVLAMINDCIFVTFFILFYLVQQNIPTTPSLYNERPL